VADRPWGSLLVLRRLHRVPDSRTPHITDGRDRGLRDAPGLNLAPTPNRRPPVSDKDRVEGRRPSSDLALSPLGGLDEVSVAASQSDRSARQGRRHAVPARLALLDPSRVRELPGLDRRRRGTRPQVPHHPPQQGPDDLRRAAQAGLVHRARPLRAQAAVPALTGARRASVGPAAGPRGGQRADRLLERVHALVQPVQRGHQPVEQIGELLHVLVELLPGPLSAPLRRR